MTNEYIRPHSLNNSLTYMKASYPRKHVLKSQHLISIFNENLKYALFELVLKIMQLKMAAVFVQCNCLQFRF